MKKISEWIDKFFSWLEKNSVYFFTFARFYYEFVVHVFFLFWADSNNEKYICGKVYNELGYTNYKFKDGRWEVYVKFCKETLFDYDFIKIRLKSFKSRRSYSLDDINYLYNCVHFLLKDSFFYRFFFYFIIKAWFNKVVKAKYGIFCVSLYENFKLDIKDNNIGKSVVLDIFWVVLLNTYMTFVDRLCIKSLIAKAYLEQIMKTSDSREIKRVCGLVWPWWKFWYYSSWLRSKGNLQKILDSYILLCKVLGDLGVTFEQLLEEHERRIKDNLKIDRF